MVIYSDCQYFLYGMSVYSSLRRGECIQNDFGIFVIFSKVLSDVYAFESKVNYREYNIVFCHYSVINMLKGTTNRNIVFLDIHLSTPCFLEKILTDETLISILLEDSQCELFSYLTITEKKIIEMVAADMSPTEFCISTQRKYKTCMLHKSNAMKKLDVHSFVQFYFKCKIIKRNFLNQGS